MTSGSTADRRALLLLVGGFIVLQIAWILTLPPFRGIDEFDHAYRAAAVARGDWVAPATDATRGTGAFLSVPRDIVLAAGPECRALSYTTAADCEPGADRGDGLVEVASGAGRYNPVFYGIAGTAALPFDGYAALYAMRVATAVVSTGLLAAGVWSLLRWSRGAWPLSALVVAMTPVLVYSSSIVAPNGVEMAAAVAVWAGAWGLLVDPHRRRLHLVTAAVGACALAGTRSLGPLWLALILLAVLAAAGPPAHAWQRIRELARDRWVLAATALVLVVTAASCAWILAMRSLTLGLEEGLPTLTLGQRLEAAAEAVPLWVLQSVAAFPSRNDAAPASVYVTALVLLGGLALVALRRGSRRPVVVAAAVALAGLLIPFAITVATFGDFGVAYQGRYSLPFTIGVPLLLGIAVERHALPHRPVRLLVPAAVLLGIEHAVSVGRVVSQQRRVSPLAGTEHWAMPPTWVVSVLAATGVCLLCWAVWIRAAAPTTVQPA